MKGALPDDEARIGAHPGPRVEPEGAAQIVDVDVQRGAPLSAPVELDERLPKQREPEPFAAPVGADAELADVARMGILRQLRQTEREAGDSRAVLGDEPERRVEVAVFVQPPSRLCRRSGKTAC